LSQTLTKLVSLVSTSIYIHLDGEVSEEPARTWNRECKKIIYEMSRRDEKVKVKFNVSNLGGQMGVLNAIDWFFDNEKLGIILEEDIDFESGIFDFFTQYKSKLDDTSLFALCFFNPIKGKNSDFILNHWVPWGWATSSRNWYSIRDHLTGPEIRVTKKGESGPCTRFAVRKYLNDILKKVDLGSVSTWDAQVHAQLLNTARISLFPSQSLTKHVGNVVGATHADLKDWWNEIKVNPYRNCPLQIDLEKDNLVFEKIWRMSLLAHLSDTFHIAVKRLIACSRKHR